ncbi:hypothetical protein K0U07_00475 [bacterium]|nr:hypothetical protein [bacterium]
MQSGIQIKEKIVVSDDPQCLFMELYDLDQKVKLYKDLLDSAKMLVGKSQHEVASIMSELQEIIEQEACVLVLKSFDILKPQLQVYDVESLQEADAIEYRRFYWNVTRFLTIYEFLGDKAPLDRSVLDEFYQ